MQEQVDKERLIRLRQEGAVRVCTKLGVDALVGTQYDNVQYITDLRRFFVYGWEPNSIAVINREQGVKLLEPGAFVAPGPHWQNEGATLKQDTGWDHFTIFNANLIAERYAGWTKGALEALGVRQGKVGIDRVSWVILDAFKSEMPGIEFVNAEEALLLGLVLIWAWLRFRRSRRRAWLVVIGAVAGWTFITRPVDALCFIVPVFTLKVERVIYSNLAQLISNQIERTHQIKFQDTTIFAQEALVEPADPKHPNDQMVRLGGIMIVSYEKVDSTIPDSQRLQVPREFYLAKQATVFIRRSKNDEYTLEAKLENPTSHLE